MAFRDLEADHPLRRMLMTPREGHLLDDGLIFTHPRPLRGVPVDRITEDHDYWRPSWKSLDQYIAGEAHQESEKERYRAREASITGAMSTEAARVIKEKHKLHSDNVSKQRKIREIFGPSTAYHPNQVVAKEYLPPDGLCEQEIMYKLACKISDMQVLSSKGELSMDPFDFIRWRIARKMMEKDIWKRGAKHNPVRSIITKLGDDGPIGSGKHYEDPLFRAAILRSAKLQGNSNKFGRKKTADKDSNGRGASSTRNDLTSARRRRRATDANLGKQSASAEAETKEEKTARMRERRRELAKLSSTGYAGTARPRGPK